MLPLPLHPVRIEGRRPRLTARRAGAFARAVLVATLALCAFPASRAAAGQHSPVVRAWTASSPALERWQVPSHLSAALSHELRRAPYRAPAAPRSAFGGPASPARAACRTSGASDHATAARAASPRCAPSLLARGFDATAPPA